MRDTTEIQRRGRPQGVIKNGTKRLSTWNGEEEDFHLQAQRPVLLAEICDGFKYWGNTTARVAWL